MIDCTGQPNLFAYIATELLSEDNELINTAPDLYAYVSEYDPANAPYSKKTLVKHNGFIYISLSDDNNEVLDDETNELSVDGFLELDMTGLVEVVEVHSRVFGTANPPNSGGLTLANGYCNANDKCSKIAFSSGHWKGTSPAQYATYYLYFAPQDMPVNTYVRFWSSPLGSVQATNIHSNRSTTNAYGTGNDYIDVLMNPNEFVAYAVYEDTTDNTIKHAHFSVGEVEAGTTWDSDDPLSLAYSYVNRRFYKDPAVSVVPSYDLNPAIIPTDNNYKYHGWTVPLSSPEIRDEAREVFSTLQAVGDVTGTFRVTHHLNSDVNRTLFKLPPSALNFQYTLKNDLTKWSLIGSINEHSIYQPSARIQTLANGDLHFRWSLTKAFTDLVLASLTGESITIKLLDPADPSIEFLLETVDLTDLEASIDYMQWLFGDDTDAYQKLLVLKDLGWAEEALLDVVITGSNTGIGAIYPTKARTLGLMTYAPIISGINTTRRSSNAKVVDVEVIRLGSATEKVNYKTETPSEWLDTIVEALESISVLAAEQGYPTYFEGEYPYDSLKILGYMPTYDQTLSNKRQTTSSLNITGAL